MDDKFAQHLAKRYAAMSYLFGKKEADTWLHDLCKRKKYDLELVAKHIQDLIGKRSAQAYTSNQT